MTGLIGQSIGRYEIIEEIGRGGMATVYRARQTSIDRDVAVKVLPSQFTQDPTFIERFNHEGQIIAQLAHARVLPVYDFGEHEGRPYIVMAYMPGGTLTHRLRSQVLGLDEVVGYVGQIAEGLDYLHQRGVIHRDFKPSNVLLDSMDNAFLADFGIAKVSEATAHLTGTGIIGTPAYMAPEMFEKGNLSTAVDVYALGASLYQLLSGRSPFTGEPFQIMRAHLYEPVPDVREMRPDVPGSVQRVIQTAMAKDPILRYPTAGDMAEALRHAVEVPEGKPHQLDLVILPEASTRTAVPTSPDAPTIDVPGDWVGTGGTSVPTPATTLPGAPPKRELRRWVSVGVGIAALIAIVAGTIFALTRAGEEQVEQPATTGLPLLVEAAPVETPAPDTASSATVISVPVAAPTDDVETPASTEEVIVPSPAFGGGTGKLGFNAAGQGFLVDVDCILSDGEGCDPAPAELPLSDSILPHFGRWSPDGARIAFAGEEGLYVMDADGNATTMVTETASAGPAWSPDGQHLAFASDDNIWQADIGCVERAGSDCLMQLTDNLLSDTRPFWSPDGTRIAFLQRQPSAFDVIFAVGVGGGDLSQLTPSGFNVIAAQWMPDGARMLFSDVYRSDASSPGASFYDIGLNIIDLGGGEPIRFVTFSEGDFGIDCALGLCRGGGEFDLSPDGRRVVISMTPNAREDTELYLLDLACLDAGPERCQEALEQLTDNEVDDNTPIWSPDGTLIAFIRPADTKVQEQALDSSARNTGANVFVMNIADSLGGGGAIQITTLGFVDFVPLQWQPLSRE